MSHINVDNAEISKFDAIKEDWWNPNGEMRLLHQLNPLRLNYIRNHVNLENCHILDVGCGGGILTESLTANGATVFGIDLSPNAIHVASAHAKKQNLNIHYLLSSVEEMSELHPEKFDVITCMELLEHVPDPQSILLACSRLLKPEGSVFFSTLNRNLKSFLQAIIGAEYVLNLLPKGTHHYAKFIRPSELVHWANQANLNLIDLKGIHYNFLNDKFTLTSNVDVNYLAYFKLASTTSVNI